MTDTISDEARTKLAEILRGIDSSSVKDDDRWWETSTGAEFGRQKLTEIDALFQSALTAARNKALEDAADVCPIYCGVPQGFTACHLISNAILAMKVQS